MSYRRDTFFIVSSCCKQVAAAPFIDNLTYISSHVKESWQHFDMLLIFYCIKLLLV